jgi:hypothetical protein
LRKVVEVVGLLERKCTDDEKVGLWREMEVAGRTGWFA